MAVQVKHQTLWACAALQWVVFAVVVLTAAMTSKCNANVDLKCQADVAHLQGGDAGDAADDKLDDVFRFAGPAFPPILLCISLVLLQFKRLVEAGVLKEFDHGMESEKRRTGWTFWMCSLCIGIQLLRMALYPLMKMVNTYASDHVFLATSMMAQVQIILTVAAHVLHQRQFKDRAVAVIVLGLLLLLAINMEVFTTARFFHTVEADFVGLASGYILFGGAAFYWTKKVDDHAICAIDIWGNRQLDSNKDYILLA